MLAVYCVVWNFIHLNLLQNVYQLLIFISISFSRHTPPPMIFGRRPMSPLAQRIRKSGHIYPLSAISMESVDNLGRRRSLSLDDLGIKTSSNQTERSSLTQIIHTFHGNGRQMVDMSWLSDPLSQRTHRLPTKDHVLLVHCVVWNLIRLNLLQKFN